MRWLPSLVTVSLLSGCSLFATATDVQAAATSAPTNPRSPAFNLQDLVDPLTEARRQFERQHPSKPAPKQLQAMLDAPLIAQNPELRYGCEVTSLAMMLAHAGVKVEKMELFHRIRKDLDPLQVKPDGDVIAWGDPDDGFVGDMTGKRGRGYSVNAAPMQELAEQYLPERILNLSGTSFEAVLDQLRAGKPVVVWTTAHFHKPRKWDMWQHGREQIRGTREMHAVLLVGFDEKYVYMNDPLTRRQHQRADRQAFEQSWIALGRQALSYR
ncbi:MAG TPA: C39 family peptidase [Bacilli bacterium]|nr:C39 family peptidase [Bacilli bacterium]